MARKKIEPFIGQKIVAILPMTKKMLDAEGWDPSPHAPAVVVKLENGNFLYPARDAEGNGPGALFGVDHGQTVILT